MTPKLVKAKHAGEYRVWLCFEDGLEGEIDLSNLLWGPVFQPLKDIAFFARLFVNQDWHTLEWPGEIDIAPESLYTSLQAVLREHSAAE